MDVRIDIDRMKAALPGPWEAIGVPSVKPKLPHVLAMVGLPGSGKSTLAKAIYQNRQDAFYIGSENVAYAMFQKDKCSTEEYRKVYDWIYRAIELIVNSGHGVIFDSTNGLKQYRQTLLDKVGNKGKLTFVQLEAPDEVLLERLNKRPINHEQLQSIAGEVNQETFMSFKNSFEPLGDDENGLTIDCQIPLDEQIKLIGFL